MAKIIVGMSGGVDSAVAAYLLKEQGHEVVGLTLRTWDADQGYASRCCEIDDAREAAKTLGIAYHVLNCTSAFQSCVSEPFVEDYLAGRTPNPCIGCNRFVKWERMLYFMHVLGADFVATGHYASVVRKENGRFTVKTAAHAEKDQTYMLYRLTQEQLQATVMPLGGLSKEEVRAIAASAGLSVAGKRDSQEICFVPEGSYADYICEHAQSNLPGEGFFVDEDGNVLGPHKGIIHYTVGQRKGLGLAFGHPMYVKKIDVPRNEVVLAPESSLYSSEVVCEDPAFMSIPPLAPGEEIPCSAKIRYRHPAQPATLSLRPDGRAVLRFETPVRAAAPGQSAVFYDEEGCVIGGGTIALP